MEAKKHIEKAFKTNKKASEEHQLYFLKLLIALLYTYYGEEIVDKFIARFKMIKTVIDFEEKK